MDLEEQLKLQLDKDEIKELRAKYCYTWDSREQEAFLSLFTEDCVFDVKRLDAGLYEGKDEIEEFFVKANTDASQFYVHMAHNPVIDVDGDTATGKWYFEVPTTFPDGTAGWVQGTYDEEYRRIDGEWKFEKITVLPNYAVGYDEGWADAV